MTRVLLVTGSRSLADIPGAEAWARALLRDALTDVDLLIVGDAEGPDAWAWDEAEMQWFSIARGRDRRVDRRRIHCYVTRGDFTGDVILHDGDPYGGERFCLEKESRWAATKRPRGGDELRRWLLSRNEAMVSEASCWHRCPVPADVLCLALLDGTKRDAPGKRATHGTEHTAGLAERAGITVRREVWT